MAHHPSHPPHPQFLDVDWPQNHDSFQTQPLQLENEYDLDPSRFDILQGQLQPPPNMSRLRQQQQQQQAPDFLMNNMDQREQFGNTGNYMFTFSDPQSHQFNQAYGSGQFFPDNQDGAFTGTQRGQGNFPNMNFGESNQSMPSSPYYPDDPSAFTYGQAQGLALGQQNPGLTPTMRSFQGDVQRGPVYSNVPSPITPNFGSAAGFGMGTQTGLPYHDQSSGAPHAAKRMRALDDAEGDTSSVDGDAPEEGGAQAKGDSAKPHKP